MKIIDTHTHLNAYQFKDDIDEVIKRAKDAGVTKVINNGDTFDSFKYINDLAEKYPDFCYSALGIYPEVEYDDLDETISKLEEQIKASKNIVAIGEIGLDYHTDNSPETKAKQKALFKAQIELGRKLELPLIVHSRDAEADTLNTIINSKYPYPITLHCYSASFQMALRYLRHKKNIYFGIGGVLTFKNARKLVETVERVPLENLVIETDAPYLAPVPYRGQRNEPSYMGKALEKIAEIKNLPLEEVEETIYKTSLSIYKF